MDSPKAHTTPILCFQTLKCLIDTLYKYFYHWVCLCWAITIFVRKKFFFEISFFVQNWKIVQNWTKNEIFEDFVNGLHNALKSWIFVQNASKKFFETKSNIIFENSRGILSLSISGYYFSRVCLFPDQLVKKKGKKIRMPLFVVRYSIALPYIMFSESKGSNWNSL